MTFNLKQTTEMLKRFPSVVSAVVRYAPEAWLNENEGGSSWNVRQVLAHLIHAEHMVWIPRAGFLLQHGETEPFPSFAREPTAGVAATAELLSEFSAARARSIQQLRALRLTPEQLELRGTHPAFGSVRLRELLAAWAAHDLDHMHQITRVLAKQHSEGVGPWRAFLGVLRCDGHGDSA